MTMLRPVLALTLLAACGGTDADKAGATAPPAAAADPAAAAPVTANPAAPAVAGDPARPVAPDFTLPDLDGTSVSLSSLRGKTVVLEWFNPGCPFIKYAHGDGPLKDMAARTSGDDVVWLAINSGAEGKQGAGVATNTSAARTWKIAHPVLLDADGTVGKAYGATATPHMFVVDPDGRIAYRGALDDAPLGRPGAAGGVNYVEQALAALAAGRSPDPAETKPYGCSVKYAD